MNRMAGSCCWPVAVVGRVNVVDTAMWRPGIFAWFGELAARAALYELPLVTVRGCSWLFVAVRGCSWLFVAVRGCSWLFVAVRG
jgi:hypothetical protein